MSPRAQLKRRPTTRSPPASDRPCHAGGRHWKPARHDPHRSAGEKQGMLKGIPKELWAFVQYNECDALTTYLLWLRAALLAGHLTPEQHAHEEELFEALPRCSRL